MLLELLAGLKKIAEDSSGFLIMPYLSVYPQYKVKVKCVFFQSTKHSPNSDDKDRSLFSVQDGIHTDLSLAGKPKMWKNDSNMK